MVGEGLWIVADILTADRMNMKTLYIGAAAPGTTYAGMLWFDTDDDKLYQRNAADDAWIERTGELDSSLGVDDTGSGIITVDTVGENVSAGEVLFMESDGKYWKADADTAAKMPATVMAMGTILADAAGKLLHVGYFRHDAWAWVLGAGAVNLLFASVTPGAMSQTSPVGSGDQVQVCGYVVTADIVFFNPSYVVTELI
jgi:roadblock/LC7 domain-containing protein